MRFVLLWKGVYISIQHANNTARLFVYIKNLVPRGAHSRWNWQATDKWMVRPYGLSSYVGNSNPQNRSKSATTNNANHNIIDLLNNNDNGINCLPLKLAYINSTKTTASEATQNNCRVNRLGQKWQTTRLEQPRGQEWRQQQPHRPRKLYRCPSWKNTCLPPPRSIPTTWHYAPPTRNSPEPKAIRSTSKCASCARKLIATSSQSSWASTEENMVTKDR